MLQKSNATWKDYGIGLRPLQVGAGFSTPGIDLLISPKAQVDLTGSLKDHADLHHGDGQTLPISSFPSPELVDKHVLQHATGPAHPSSVRLCMVQILWLPSALGQSLPAGHYLAEYTLGQISASVGHGVPIF